MSKSDYHDKIKLLEALDIDLWVNKKNSQIDNTIARNIIIQDFIYEKQPEIIDNFLVAAKKSLKDVEVSYLNFEKIINLTTTELNSSVKSIFLIICNDDVVRRITTSKFKDKYIKETKNNRYMFNTLLVSDKITSEIKKAVWEDFLQIKDYE
tara:strand:+ start:141 stop:596 length:456 start_codon:yes stop_codon:yes gene_type:complete